MASFEQNDNHVFMEHHELSPRVGPDHQVEIPSMIKNSNQLSDSEYVHYDKSLSSDIGLPVSVTWCDADTKCLLLGLFIFGKNFIQIKRFLENKGMGEILSFYYGKFYKTNGYRRWSECRKLKGRKCILGKKLFSEPRQRELLSRLIPHVSQESQDTLFQVSNSYMEGRISLEDYISSLKSTVGLGVLVDAIGIGNVKGDLTRFRMKHGKINQAQTCKDLSSLGPSDIIQSLTGGIRLSKTKSNELFWEAIWPRLLARGWHSEQPKYRGYVTSKDYLVFLIPSVDKFSRRKLVKGDHYFDSISDVLSKVVAEPDILVLKEEEEAKVGSCSEEELEKGSNVDDLSDDHRQCYLKPRSSTYSKDHIKSMFIDTSLVHGRKPSSLRELKSVPDNSVCKVEVDAAGKKFKGEKYMRKVKHGKDMLKSTKQKLTKLAVIDTNRLPEGKLLKLKVKQLKHPSVEIEDSSKMTPSLLRESKSGSSTDVSPKIVKTEMLICSKKMIIKTDSSRGVFNSGTINKNEAYDNPDNDADKVVKSQENQHPFVFDDSGRKRIMKHQFNKRVRSGDSNHTAVPIKMRRLSACAKAEKSHTNENLSEKLGFSRSSNFCEAKKIVCDRVSHRHNGSSTASFADRSVEENNQKNILNDSYQCTRVSSSKVDKCESFTFNISQVSSKAENSIMMAKAEEGEQGLKAKDPCLTSATQEEVEEPLKTLCDVDSLEQRADTNPRRQSTRNRPLTVRALECIANEFLHVQKRPKKKDIQTHRDPFNSCRKARTSGKTVLCHHCPDHGNAVSVQEEKHLIEDVSNS